MREFWFSHESACNEPHLVTYKVEKRLVNGKSIPLQLMAIYLIRYEIRFVTCGMFLGRNVAVAH